MGVRNTRDKKVARVDRGKSPVRAAVLAVLVEREGHGWDVARRTNRRVGRVWIDPKHIYSHLGWLEQEGLVRLEQESSDRHPYRRDVYYATDAGVEAREEWLAAPLASGAAGRTDLERRLLFSTRRDVPVLLRAVAYRRAELAGEIDENAASGTVPVSYLAAMINLQRSSVDKRLKAEMEWLAEARRELEDQRDKPSPR